jgi:hypothetical protein
VKRVLVSVEGQTEETFIRDVLRDYLHPLDIHLIPSIVNTKIVKDGPNFKGGLINYQRARRDIQKLLTDSNAVAVTTFYDLYGLPTDFPGYDTRPPQPYAKVNHLETEFSNDINHSRFRPYLQLHEFETFLFVEPDTTSQMLGLGESEANELSGIRSRFSNPEEINDDPLTAPSIRLQSIYDAYEKVLDGPLVTLELGLSQLRQACQHFDAWVTWLEGL